MKTFLTVLVLLASSSAVYAAGNSRLGCVGYLKPVTPDTKPDAKI